MPETSRPEYIFTTTSPWVVGREALLEYAVEDFLHHATRQQPWLRARYEALLGTLVEALEEEHGAPPTVSTLTPMRANRWLTSVGAQRDLAERALFDFADYLVRWRWVASHPLKPVQVV